jgi:hypothetical protein
MSAVQNILIKVLPKDVVLYCIQPLLMISKSQVKENFDKVMKGYVRYMYSSLSTQVREVTKPELKTPNFTYNDLVFIRIHVCWASVWNALFCCIPCVKQKVVHAYEHPNKYTDMSQARAAAMLREAVQLYVKQNQNHKSFSENLRSFQRYRLLCFSQQLETEYVHVDQHSACKFRT